MINLKGASVALVGLGDSQREYTSSVANGAEYDEVWAVNSMLAPIKHDRVFMMDPPSRFFETDLAGKQTSALRRELPKHPGPIYTCELDNRVPGAVLYPLEEIVAKTGLCYFNNTIPYAIAFAIYSEIEKLFLYGIDYSYKTNLHMAESGRACTEFWLSAAIARGMKVDVALSSALLDTDVPIEEKLYGYHRLDDPLIMSVKNDTLLLTKKSNVEPPEPLDGQPVLYERNDKVVSMQRNL
tara:strand:- start:237 stop:956 length:720 start_codon:yes stop_codon:yes gene_type:complete